VNLVTYKLENIQTAVEMKFECKELSINDEPFGCSVSLSNTQEDLNFEKKLTVDEIIDSFGQYVMLQRTYAEDEFEEDYYYFETNEIDKSGELNDFEIILTKNEFTLSIENEKYEIQINLTEQELNELKEALKILTEHKGRLLINI